MPPKRKESNGSYFRKRTGISQTLCFPGTHCRVLSDLMFPSCMLVPGFANALPRPSSQNLCLITFGRMDRAKSDRIKQGGLAVAGFASAVKEASKPGLPKKLKNKPQMRVVGINKPNGGTNAKNAP